MGKLIKKREGITLIALIVTIVILLILAGVSIAMLTGDNGILSQAQNAKNKTEEAERNEKLDLLKQEDLINETLNGVEVEQVTDEKPGELEKEDENTLVINSIEDLVFFAYDVTKGNNYSGKTVKLGTSLDFNSTKSYVDPLRTDYVKYGYNGELKTLLTTGEGFKTIGTIYDSDVSMNHFYGVFDGNYNTICNLYQDVEESDKVIITGLFGTNNGTIKNLQIKNVNLNASTNNMYVLIGAITGRNAGKIENSSSSGVMSIKANGNTGINAGGISEQGSATTENNVNKSFSNIKINVETNNNDGLTIGGIGNAGGKLISNCYFNGKIIVTGSKDNEKYIGGICSGATEIRNCYNLGKIEVRTEENSIGKTTYIGGISYGTNNINNCFNIGEIECYNPHSCVGGIGANEQSGNIVNCYNVGNLTLEGENKIYGSLVGVGKNLTIENSKWLIGTAPSSVGNNLGDVTDNSESVDDLEKIISVLEVINGERAFKEDTNNINNGYPILSWE